MRPESRWSPKWVDIIVLSIGALIGRGHMPKTRPDRPKAPDEARRGKDSRWGPQARFMWTHLEKALLLKLIREHEVATSESCESGAGRPAPTA